MSLLPIVFSPGILLLGLVNGRNSLELPQPLVNTTLMAVRGALAPNTKSTYAADQLQFTQFCDKWNISKEDCMPVSYLLLCAFIGEHKGLQSGNTIRSWMSGLHSWHVVNHAPWYGDNKWVHLAHISANKEGTRHKRPLRAQVSIKHLSALHHAIILSDPFHAVVFAIALCTFFGCCCLGKTTVTVDAAFNKQYHVTCSVKCIILAGSYHYMLTLFFFSVEFHSLCNGSHSMSFHIPWMKTTKELSASVVLTVRDGSPLCPVAALKNHIAVNASILVTFALFAYTTPLGQPKNMLKHKFLEFVTGIWSSAMLAHVLGHSFCIGGAVELLLAGCLLSCCSHWRLDLPGFPTLLALNGGNTPYGHLEGL